MNEKTVLVGDIMRSHFVIVDGMVTVAAAMARMCTENADALIVDKRHEDDEYGIVLLSDIVTKVLAVNRAPERVNLYEIMSKPIVTVDAGMKDRYCARLFSNLGISTAPVVRDKKIIGTVSYRELAFDRMTPQSANQSGS